MGSQTQWRSSSGDCPEVMRRGGYCGGRNGDGETGQRHDGRRFSFGPLRRGQRDGLDEPSGGTSETQNQQADKRTYESGRQSLHDSDRISRRNRTGHKGGARHGKQRYGQNPEDGDRGLALGCPVGGFHAVASYRSGGLVSSPWSSIFSPTVSFGSMIDTSPVMSSPRDFSMLCCSR